MKYNDDVLTPEEEAALMALQDPRKAQPAPLRPMAAPRVMPQAAPAPRMQIDPRLQQYLQMRMPDTGAKSMIDSAAMQGIAGGLAQVGTVHGQTPSAAPFIDAQKQMGAALGRNKGGVDPRVAQYLLQKNKDPKLPVWKKVGVTPEGKNIYSDGTREWLGDEKNYRKPIIGKASGTSKEERKAAGETFVRQKQLDLFDQIEDAYLRAYNNDDAGPVAGKWAGLKRYGGYSVSEDYDFAESSLGKNLASYIKEQSGTAASDREVARLQKLMPSMDTEPGRFKTDMQILRNETMLVINKLRAEQGLPELPTPQRAQKASQPGQTTSPSNQYAKALEWAKKNPNDPRAIKILEKLMKKGQGVK